MRILRPAEADLQRIKDYIEIDNPAAARATIRRVRERPTGATAPPKAPRGWTPA